MSLQPITIEWSTERLAQQLRRVVKGAEHRTADVVRATALKAIRKIMLRWPVDTGRSRAAWEVSGLALGASAPSGGQALAVAQGRLQGRIEERLRGLSPEIRMVNEVEYAMRLEDGHSEQAPIGAVRLTLLELARALPASTLRELRAAWDAEGGRDIRAGGPQPSFGAMTRSLFGVREG